jgi:hypothetical protein
MTVSALHLGLPEPASDPEIDDVPSIAHMRREILSGARQSRLIRECLEVAENFDLHEEEMYVWLAYQALIRLEEMHRTCKCSESGSPVNLDAIDGHF